MWQRHIVDKDLRAGLKRQRPCLLWFTGLSGSGKSTIAGLVEQRLAGMGMHTYLLDGDNIRQGLCRDLGFSAGDRVENIRRIGEVARLMVDAGLVTLTAFISPFRSDREMVRRLLPNGEFVEVFVDAPLEECERRDPKGLYRKARAGQLSDFTGIDSPYEAPLAPAIHLETARHSAEACAAQVIDYLSRAGFLRHE
ncbi:MAG TPA: adenylyl-sulfate kinase [Paucimonas sp.]|nr:adenylyl-sulfate kinase [Paucimonas sp.]